MDGFSRSATFSLNVVSASAVGNLPNDSSVIGSASVMAGATSAGGVTTCSTKAASCCLI